MRSELEVLVSSFVELYGLWREEAKRDHFVTFYLARVCYELIRQIESLYSLENESIKEKFLGVLGRNYSKWRAKGVLKLLIKKELFSGRYNGPRQKGLCHYTVEEVTRCKVDQNRLPINIFAPLDDPAVVADYYESIAICFIFLNEKEKAQDCLEHALKNAYKVKEIAASEPMFQYIYSEKELKDVPVGAFIKEVEDLLLNLDNIVDTVKGVLS